ncbi:glycogen debranching N-terminal domain-containing protein [Herbiconiux sp. L3-i23]|uniref:glycogen debranching N-terminal domain-containing protein n=1 Tax=Herbiconiux sp. L3-i23 TaxID=2905871 RepID=UPI002046C717|nr:amylo-alpha-1,6-glucosidase [Herbiconiux sp. L3-i23]
MTGLQPLLDQATVALSAPAQAWSTDSGAFSGRGIHGFYVGDRRIISVLDVSVDGADPETISTATSGADRAEFVSLLRGVDDSSADPRVRLRHSRLVAPSSLRDTYLLESTLSSAVTATLTVRLGVDFAEMDAVKAGLAEHGAAIEAVVDGDGSATWTGDGIEARLTAAGASLSSDAGLLVLSWPVEIPAKGSTSVTLEVSALVADAVVGPPVSPSPWSEVTLEAEDVRLRRWVERALDDLAALRMSVASVDDAVFLAAGAPWFFTLFGRDSIWAARMLLPLGTGLAADTLRVLATMQGTKRDPETAEQPGKIMHELRAAALEIPAEGVVLPPLYYGTVDATALWVNLLHDAWRWGLADEEIEPLLSHLEAALAWLRDYGDSDGDGFLEYIDESGRGLANQGWKDSGDSVQWNDGRLADGPIALCEVQAYAYEAAMGGAALLDHFDRPGAAEWRSWAAELKRKFSEQFWVDGPDGAYPAIALDAAKKPVDSLTSNIGHLLGTGILGREQANLVASHLVSSKLSSGYGLRTMSTDAAGYWPLSYHGGSVWAHDTAIAVLGLQREGFAIEAATLSEGLLAAAEGFGYRMPELHSGDSAADTSRPIPYPAACRPQAWSAAAAIAVLTASLGLAPEDRESLAVDASGSTIARGVRFSGARVGEAEYTVEVTADGRVSARSN